MAFWSDHTTLASCTCDGNVADSNGRDDQLLELDEALGKLQTQDPRKADVIKLRFFAGLTHREIAAQLGLSLSTIEKDWRTARAWLLAELDKGPSRRREAWKPGGKGQKE